jgi:hypothetical protein
MDVLDVLASIHQMVVEEDFPGWPRKNPTRRLWAAGARGNLLVTDPVPGSGGPTAEQVRCLEADAASIFIEPDVEVDAIGPPVDVALLITLTQLCRVRRTAKALQVRDTGEFQILG